MPREKPLPHDTSFQGLFGPNTEYAYFQDAEAHRFLAQATRFQLRNAWWCAEASMLVYVRDPDFVRGRLHDAGLTGFHDLEVKETGTQGFVAHNHEFALVCFRGTEVEEIEDIETDARFALVRLEVRGRKCRVHQGFATAFESVREKLESHLSTLGSRPVWFTGHSLGASIATLAAHHHGDAQGVYTFGAPRVGDRDFRAQYEEPTYRFVHNNDIVTRIPPPGFFALPYRHVGLVKYIDAHGEIHDNFSLWTRIKGVVEGELEHFSDLWQRLAKGDLDATPPDVVKDHGPEFYTSRIWNSYLEEIAGLRS